MDESDLNKLFMPFTQADDSISRKFGGTGLGLSITKLLVELMQGRVWADSQPGQGSIFYFTVWFRKQNQQSKLPVPSIDLQKLNVLLVEDNQSSLKILKEALESFTFKVTAMESGIQAIQFLRENHARQPVQLVLMDWSMVEMDGLQAAEIIRRDQQFKDIRIIMLCTSYANEDLYKRVEELNLDGILIKPVKYSTLYDTIINAFRAEGMREKTAASELQQDVVTTGEHVLLVEDNKINQQVASELLLGFGYSVEIANNGLEALDKVRQSGRPSRFSLVLMDLQMPVMGGYKATAEIKKLSGFETLPIIAMTADAMDGVREKCLEVGMVDFISKPVNPKNLFEVLRRWSGPAREPKIPETKSSKKNREKTGFPKLAGIDTADGLSRLNGNEKLYQELLSMFLQDHQHFIEHVIAEFNRGETAGGRRLVHTLKGTSASLGMIKVHAAVVTAEKELKDSGERRDLSAILLPVKTELEYVLKSLEKNLERKSTIAVPLSLLEAKPLLNELERLLTQQDLDALKILNKIGNVSGYERQMEQVKLAVDKFDFNKAQKFLKEIKLDV